MMPVVTSEQENIFLMNFRLQVIWNKGMIWSHCI